MKFQRQETPRGVNGEYRRPVWVPVRLVYEDRLAENKRKKITRDCLCANLRKMRKQCASTDPELLFEGMKYVSGPMRQAATKRLMKSSPTEEMLCYMRAKTPTWKINILIFFKRILQRRRPT